MDTLSTASDFKRRQITGEEKLRHAYEEFLVALERAQEISEKVRQLLAETLV